MSRNDKPRSLARQASRLTAIPAHVRDRAKGVLLPLYLIEKASGGYAVVARDRDKPGVLHVSRLTVVPEPRRRLLIRCFCCGAASIFCESHDGVITHKPFTPDDGDGGAT